MIFKIIKKIIYLILFITYSVALLGGGLLLYPSLIKETTENNTLAKSEINLSTPKLFELIQHWRTKMNLTLYEEHDELCRVADIRLDQIKKNFSHDDFFKISKKSTMSENLVYSYPNEEDTLKAWILSPTHLNGLIQPYKYSCLRCSGTYCVQIFSNLENGY